MRAACPILVLFTPWQVLDGEVKAGGAATKGGAELLPALRLFSNQVQQVEQPLLFWPNLLPAPLRSRRRRWAGGQPLIPFESLRTWDDY